MRRRLVVLVLVIGLMLFSIPPAFAGGTAYCSTGGYGYTYSNAFADHKFGSSIDYNINGSKYHGYFTGNQLWDVYNPNPPIESGWCVT